MSEGARTGDSSLQRWVDQLSEQDMPVLGDTVRRLHSAATDRSTSAPDLARIVLRDAAMTSGVIKAVNTVYYNSASRRITTISRAVVILGFETVRTIGTSVAVIETFLRAGARRKLLELMHESVFAAVYAKAIARCTGDPEPEEVFIAALLYRLGPMAFWCYADDTQAQRMESALDAGDKPRNDIEREILGFSLNNLTRSLTRRWKLGEVVQETLDSNPNRPTGRAGTVHLGHRVERAVREHGWDSTAVQRLTREIAAHTGATPEDITRLLDETRSEVHRAAEAFGLIPANPDPCAPAQPASSTGPSQPCPELQLRILRELSQLLQDNPDLQSVLDMVLEGIYRGVGMDRTLVAVLSRDRRHLSVRYTLGDSGELQRGFGFELDAPDYAIVRHTLARQHPLWTARLGEAHRRKWLTQAVRTSLGADFFLGPLVVQGKDIGVLYADRRTSATPLDDVSFDGFCHFCEQANLALEFVMAR
ncbi:HDOD domain-containing protein [Arhodomonas sp. AD133]|uniref:HDOD domain-containing protein n=1 Tax=Arhodomonas sp. AD133 TaxID=3415009 RepID=UPI003EBC747B